MGFPDHHIPPFMMMSTPQYASETDAIDVRLQFPIPNELCEPLSPVDQPPLPKRAKTSSETNNGSNNNNNNNSNAPPRMVMMQPPNNNSNNNNISVNKGTSHIFFKTRMCAKFRFGTCRNGENCNFAHGIEDMRQPPPNWQELVGLRSEERPSGNWEDDQKIIHKMKLCKKYYNGEECPYGERCSFLHEDPAKFREEPGRFRESSAISIGTVVSPKPYGDGSNSSESNRAVVNNTALNASTRGVIKSTYWKTKMCIKWDTTGHCPFGEDCHFAHGHAELQIHGGRIEPEVAGAISTSTKAATIPAIPKVTLAVSSNDAAPPPSNTAVVPISNEEGQGKKYLSKWKGPKKVNRIYADWLDDYPLNVLNLPSNGVET